MVYVFSSCKGMIFFAISPYQNAILVHQGIVLFFQVLVLVVSRLENIGIFSLEFFFISLYVASGHLGNKPSGQKPEHQVKEYENDYGVYHDYSQSMKRSLRGLRNSTGVFFRCFSTLTSSNPKSLSANDLFFVVWQITREQLFSLA